MSRELLPIPTEPFQVVFGEGPHKFCGPNLSQSATCPNCQCPLLHVATLDTREDLALHEVLTKPDQIPFFTCWSCPASERLQYQVLQGEITILASNSGSPVPGFPYENYPTEFPAATFRLEPMLEPVSDWWGGVDEVLEVHTVGGRRTLYQWVEPSICEICHTDMRLLGVFCDTNTSPLGFTNNIGVLMLFFLCRDCLTVEATHQCD